MIPRKKAISDFCKTIDMAAIRQWTGSTMRFVMQFPQIKKKIAHVIEENNKLCQACGQKRKAA